SGRRIADELGLPFGPFPEFLRQLKNNQIVAYTNSATANDYLYSLTDLGRTRAKIYSEECSYVGSAPVPFDDYVKAVTAQTITAIEGQIIKVFDMANHEPITARRSGLLRDDDFDHRWIEIKRPTLIAGGELRMEDLEIHYDPLTKICEAPLQLKSNNGTFLID